LCVGGGRVKVAAPFSRPLPLYLSAGCDSNTAKTTLQLSPSFSMDRPDETGTSTGSGLWIRIHFMQIRIQNFIPGFNVLERQIPAQKGTNLSCDFVSFLHFKLL
jgi:hypothetical protein